MEPLATADDVAHALGLEDAAALSAAQSARLDGLLARVSREFRREAERPFTDGEYTVRLKVVRGKVRLPETGTVTEVSGSDGIGLEYVVDGQEVALQQCHPSTVTVTYTHTDLVPDDVVASVAEIVARHLIVDPTSAEAQSTELSTMDFRQRMAPWVSERRLLTDEERAQARSYRYPGTAVIVQQP